MLNVLYLSGCKYYLDDYLSRVKDKLNPDNVVKINGETADAHQDICGNICTPDLMGMKTLYLINGLPAATKKVKKKSAQEHIMEHLDRVPECNFVVFYSYGNPRHDKFKKSLVKSKSSQAVKFFKDVQDANSVIEKVLENSDDKKVWIGNFSSKQGRLVKKHFGDDVTTVGITYNPNMRDLILENVITYYSGLLNEADKEKYNVGYNIRYHMNKEKWEKHI